MSATIRTALAAFFTLSVILHAYALMAAEDPRSLPSHLDQVVYRDVYKTVNDYAMSDKSDSSSVLKKLSSIDKAFEYLKFLAEETKDMGMFASIMELLETGYPKPKLKDLALYILSLEQDTQKKGVVVEICGDFFDGGEVKRFLLPLVKSENGVNRFHAENFLLDYFKNHDWIASDLRSMMYEDDISNDRKSGILLLLGQMGDHYSIDLIRTFVKSDESWKREAAVRALSFSSDEKAVQALQYALEEDDDPMVRREAAKGLYKIGNRDAVYSLMLGLKDDDKIVARRVVRALEKITGKNFGDDLAMWQKWWEAQGHTVPEKKAGREKAYDTGASAGPSLVQKISPQEAKARTTSEKEIKNAIKAAEKKSESGNDVLFIGLALALLAGFFVVKFTLANPEKDIGKAKQKIAAARPKNQVSHPKVTKKVEVHPDI